MFDFVEGVKIFYWIEKMMIYVSNIVEIYKGVIIGHLGNSGRVDLLLHIVQCWIACAVNEGNWDLTVVLTIRS